MSEVLTPVVFSPELADSVRDFDCGDEPFQSELADSLRGESHDAMRRGVKVWLYVNPAAEVVGFGALGATRWPYPGASDKKVALAVIPAVAIQRRFWGRPEGVEPGARFSSQILRQLIFHAVDWPGKPPALGLFVHPDNHAARKLYERFQFVPHHRTYTDPATGITYSSYVLALPRL